MGKKGILINGVGSSEYLCGKQETLMPTHVIIVITLGSQICLKWDIKIPSYKGKYWAFQVQKVVLEMQRILNYLVMSGNYK